MPYASPRPASLSGGKLVETTQLAIHCAPAATDSAAARILFGNDSPSSTHTTGPHDIPNANTYTLAASSATGLAAPVSTGMPPFSVAVPNTTVSAPRGTAMPIEPIISSGLRPKRSIEAIATRVVTTFTTPVITVMISESLSVNPAACHTHLEQYKILLTP